jgi:hypothetical protein
MNGLAMSSKRQRSAFLSGLAGMLAACAAALSVSTARADSLIGLELVGPTTPVAVGQEIQIRLRAKQEPQDNLVGQSFVAIDCILKWNPKRLRLLGLTTTGSVPLLSSYFPTPSSDYTGINEVNPPQDGTALYYALAQLGQPVPVPQTGVQVVTFRFRVQSAFASTQVEILPSLTVTTPADTVVYDGTVPGLDVLGTITPATIVQVVPCVGDIDANGAVNGADLSILLGQWGLTGSADIDANGIVNGADLSILLGNWGQCPGT